MSTSTANLVICGAGFAGISVAYELAVVRGFTDIIIVDDLPALSLTSDKSGECYRDWWPGPGDAMPRLASRSITLMEQMARQSDNVFHMNRRGYLYITADAARVPGMIRTAEEIASLGAGPLRYHDGNSSTVSYRPSPPEGVDESLFGADLLLDRALIRRHFPYVTPDVVAAVHARRCGWMSAQQMGMYMLDTAREHGVRLVSAKVVGVDTDGRGVKAVKLSDGAETWSIATRRFVNAAGPHLDAVGQMIGVRMPVFWELHRAMFFRDKLGILPREAPLTILTDPQKLYWTGDERAALAESPESAWMLGELPGGADLRPEGAPDGQMVMALYSYDNQPVDFIWPPPIDAGLAEIILRGQCNTVPGLRAYCERPPKPNFVVGYYTRTQENRPLICPLPVEGAYVIGALSGFGVMVAAAAGELLADYITERPLQSYAPAFDLKRYDDPEYRALLDNWPAGGEL